jgi:hypothetical protein
MHYNMKILGEFIEFYESILKTWKFENAKKKKIIYISVYCNFKY